MSFIDVNTINRVSTNNITMYNALVWDSKSKMITPKNKSYIKHLKKNIKTEMNIDSVIVVRIIFFCI